MSQAVENLILSTTGLPVTLTTLTAGEDLTNDVQKVEQRFSYSFVSNASIATVKSGSGFLHNLVIGTISTPTLTIYDNTSAAGAVIANVHANPPVGSYLIDMSFTTGLTLKFNTGATPQVTVGYR